MALFPADADDAVKCAIDMLSNWAAFNRSIKKNRFFPYQKSASD